MQLIDKLEKDLSETRSKLISHPIYNALNSKERLLFFMENHVFAVWDFMSLIKSLQINLTCVNVPWTPNENNFAGKLVNEIVLAEESDEIMNDKYISHFDLYIQAMKDIHADSSKIENLIDSDINAEYNFKDIYTYLNKQGIAEEVQNYNSLSDKIIENFSSYKKISNSKVIKLNNYGKKVFKKTIVEIQKNL